MEAVKYAFLYKLLCLVGLLIVSAEPYNLLELLLFIFALMWSPEPANQPKQSFLQKKRGSKEIRRSTVEVTWPYQKMQLINGWTT